MTETISCMIVDDDRMSMRILQSLIEKTDFLRLIQTFNNSIDAAKVLMEHEVDLLFLDVEMPDMTGLQLMEALEKRPQVIFTTSKEQYALNAFNLDAVDFLLKPVDNYARFLKAVNKVRNNIRKASVQSIAQEPVNRNDQANRIFIKIDSLLVNFDLNEVLYIEAFGDYVKIYTDKKFHVVHTKLKTVEETLPKKDFVRVHRSFIVRVDKIQNIDTANLLVGNKIIPISNSYRAALFNKIQTL